MMKKANATVDDLTHWLRSNTVSPTVRGLRYNVCSRYLDRDVSFRKGTGWGGQINSVMVADNSRCNCHSTLIFHVHHLANPASARQNFKRRQIHVDRNVAGVPLCAEVQLIER
jgi:hypothetical protein